ncbi:LytR/AlgR family response regulator transcription factor [Proteiniphilum acetatigenes]|uniref:LytR/AlgR family response regulator transcription factor n=1 Tax=Proteiniphilum acetatigenes TaxID=294710 RepID=UPI000365CFE1|nr:LytTR family DNA-binding domain-containing protein [Proteiniphilum acetatigenes]SFK44818.1 two component transcriptional regulator, LytTR family [Porphyromonadaceae bacterium KH3CP3RA]
MNAVIVEDEFAAAQNLERLIKSVDENIDIIAVLQNVDESIEWFSTNRLPDVVFMDIHLADGDSFSIFKNIEIRCPIIFTTAYDQYALKAFEVNSIDYLLKPISKNSLEKALAKLKNFSPNNNHSDVIAQIMKSIHQVNKTHKKSFLIPFKDKLIPVSSDDIAYVYSQNKKAVITCFNKRDYMMDTSLDDFLKQLDPDLFFRANRQFIISHQAVTDLSMWFDGKLAVNLSVPTPERIIVSRARSADFKKWYMKTDD